MKNSCKDPWLNNGDQAEFLTKESEVELPLLAETGIDETENNMPSVYTSSIDEDYIKFVNEIEAICQTKKETSDGENRCKICYKAFPSKSKLTIHLRVHTGERPYECDKCDKKFKIKTNLIRHYLTHTHERPHCCTTCGKSFSLSFNLSKHMLTHTKERPHICIKCNKTYARGDSFKHHLCNH